VEKQCVGARLGRRAAIPGEPAAILRSHDGTRSSGNAHASGQYSPLTSPTGPQRAACRCRGGRRKRSRRSWRASGALIIAGRLYPRRRRCGAFHGWHRRGRQQLTGPTPMRGRPAPGARGRRAVGSQPVMAIKRLRCPLSPVTLTQGALTLYEVELSVVPSPAWRAAFLRPPAPLTTAGTRRSSSA